MTGNEKMTPEERAQFQRLSDEIMGVLAAFEKEHGKHMGSGLKALLGLTQLAARLTRQSPEDLQNDMDFIKTLIENVVLNMVHAAGRTKHERRALMDALKLANSRANAAMLGRTLQ